MTGRIFTLMIVLLPLLAPGAYAEINEIPFSKIEASVELHGEAPYVGEPLRLVMRSAIHAQVANDRISQPDLTNFDWQQFGVDTITKEFIDGFWMPVMSRVLMIYPLRPGKLTIGPFRRHVTYFTPGGERTEIEISSEPLTIDVQSHDALAGPNDYWIPAKNFLIIDQWTPEPDNIPFAETTRRTITIEAEGLSADRLPNLPPFRAPGIITFAGPVQRETIITDHGPVGRAVYQWRIRPATRAVATAPPINIPWFDVSKRQMREATIPERRVTFIASGGKANSSSNNYLSSFLSSRSLIAFLLSFMLAGSTSFIFLFFQFNDALFWRSLIRSLRLFAALYIFALKDDRMNFYSIVDKLRKTDPVTWRLIDIREANSGKIDDLESALFGERMANVEIKLITRAHSIFKIYLAARLRPGRVASPSP